MKTRSRRPDRPRRLSRDAREAYLLILPFFAFFAVFVIYPLILNLINSFTNYNLASRTYVGLANYRRMFGDSSFRRSVVNTFVFAGAAVLPLLILGFLAALFAEGQSRAMRATRSALMFPYVVSMVAVSLVWLYLLDPAGGLINKLLRMVGLRGRDWLFDEKLAMPCLIALQIWKYLGYVLLINLAAIQAVPTSLHEAARTDGAGFWRRAWHVTLPSIRPVTVFLLSTLLIECFKTFDQVRILTDGGPVDATTTITHQIYLRGFAEFRMGYASAMSVVLLLIVLAVTLITLNLDSERPGDEPDRRRA